MARKGGDTGAVTALQFPMFAGAVGDDHIGAAQIPTAGRQEEIMVTDPEGDRELGLIQTCRQIGPITIDTDGEPREETGRQFGQ